MSEFNEGAPIAPVEEIKENSQELASKAMIEIDNTRLSQPHSTEDTRDEIDERKAPELKNLMPRVNEAEVISTTAVTDLKTWMRQSMEESSEITEEEIQIMKAMREIFAKDDEKILTDETSKVFVDIRINEVIAIMDDFISNPNGFRVKHPDLTSKLVDFCEKLSQL